LTESTFKAANLIINQGTLTEGGVYFLQKATLMRRSTVLSLPLQCSLNKTILCGKPVLSHKNHYGMV
jgi:hypothetical protein